jgi:DNA-binding CsgD family transcriptional regulator
VEDSRPLQARPLAPRGPLPGNPGWLPDAHAEGTPLTDDILASWNRCVVAGLQPDRFEVPHDADVDHHGRLRWAADPVLDRVGLDLTGNRVGLLLTDQRGQVVARRAGDRATVAVLDAVQLAPGSLFGEAHVGTNAIGTAIARRGPIAVEGPEHFAQALSHVTCAAIPVADPTTGQLMGVIDLTCDAKDASPLMLPLLKRAAWEIEQALLEDSSVETRSLQDHLGRAGRNPKEPLLALNGRTMIVNGAAAGLVEQGDREVLWDCALRMLGSGQAEARRVGLTSGRAVKIRCEPLCDSSGIVGVLLRLGTAEVPTRGHASAFGWSSLTDSERAVAEQVALGLTNREAAARLYLSPHTIDFHLRQLFRKLDIRSRVELTRLLLTQESEGSV